MRAGPPEHWNAIDWEAKAQENPLMAIMTTPGMADAPATDFSEETLEEFFARGRKLFRNHLAPLLKDARPGDLLVEYGCGAGRILKPGVEAGFGVAGIDISATMLQHAARLVPEAQGLYLLDEQGHAEMPDGCARLVYTYSVLQHIPLLSTYTRAVEEMCRIAAPGATLALQINCEDFNSGDPAAPPGRTENFETHSLHYRPGADQPYKNHGQDFWSGVYIGMPMLTDLLKANGVEVERWYYHNPAKLRALWVVARKAG